MKRFLLIALSAGLLAQPSQITAQQPYFYSGVPDATEYLNFLSGSGVGSYGVQVGPYLGRFESPASAPFSIYCVDYTHYARDQWVDVSALAPGQLAETRLGNSNYVRYQKAAYLSSLFDDTSYNGQWGAIHAAIWYFTSNVTVGPSSRTTFITMANNNAASFNTNGWYVLSPTNPSYSGSGQEFLMRTVSVPEPATFMLLASGLLLLAAVSRKRLGVLIERDA